MKAKPKLKNTFAFDALSKQPVEKAPTVVAESEDLVVVHGKAVRYVYTEPLSWYLLRKEEI